MSQKMTKRISTARKTGNASVSSDRRGKTSGEMNVRATQSHISTMVQMLAPRKRLMEKRLKSSFISL